MTAVLRVAALPLLPYWASSPPPGRWPLSPHPSQHCPQVQGISVFSSTSSALLKMKPIRVGSFGNKFQAEKLARCVVSGQNQTQSQDIRAIWFPPCISNGRSCGFYGIWDQFRSPTGAVFTEPRKTGAGKHTCLHTPE